MPYNYPALVDTIQNLVYDNYRHVVYDVDIQMNEHMSITVTLNFAYDKCVRDFTLHEHDFGDSV